jgi:hypothetical protein
MSRGNVGASPEKSICCGSKKKKKNEKDRIVSSGLSYPLDQY